MYLVFMSSHLSSAVLKQLPGQMMKITYSLFKLMSYQPMFINVQLICSSEQQTEGHFGANAPANIY